MPNADYHAARCVSSSDANAPQNKADVGTMNASANPYSAPEAASQQPTFWSVIVPSAVGSAVALGMAMLLDSSGEFTSASASRDPVHWTMFIFAAPSVVILFFPYFWTARILPLASKNQRSILKASLIAIFGPIIAAGCIAVAGYSNQLAKGFVSTVLPEVFADHHIVRTLRTMIVIGIIYSILYSTIHKIIFRRSRWMMLLQILFPAISMLFLCVVGPAWVKPASAKAFCTFITIFIGYIAHANCFAWWHAEPKITDN